MSLELKHVGAKKRGRLRIYSSDFLLKPARRARYARPHLSSPRALASSFFHELLCLFLCFLLTNPSSCLFACISPPPESVLLQMRPSLHFLFL